MVFSKRNLLNHPTQTYDEVSFK